MLKVQFSFTKIKLYKQHLPSLLRTF